MPMDTAQRNDTKATHRVTTDAGNGMSDTASKKKESFAQGQEAGGADPSTETQKLFQTRPLNQTTTHDPKITT